MRYEADTIIEVQSGIAINLNHLVKIEHTQETVSFYMAHLSKPVEVKRGNLRHPAEHLLTTIFPESYGD